MSTAEKDLPDDPRLPWPELGPAQEFLQVSASSTEFPDDRELAREQFRRHKAIHFRNLLQPEFLQLNLRLATSGNFVSTGSGHPEVETPQRINRVIDVAFQRSVVLRWMEDVTGATGLYTFGDRLTQTREHTKERRVWHDDLVESDKRRLALVINFSPAPYDGGEFELRWKSGEPVFRHRYQEINEAILFLVDPALQHRVLPVTAGGPRRVFAGWALAR